MIADGRGVVLLLLLLLVGSQFTGM